MTSISERLRISPKQAARIKDHAERVVVTTCLEAGFEVTQSPSIRVEKPLNTHDGHKIVHQPDYLLINPDNPDQFLYLEVANGNGDTKHKHDQEKLVKASGVDNHVFVTADIWRTIEEHSHNPDVVRDIWRQITGWQD